MKRFETQLERLFAAARDATPEAATPMPARLQFHILACWRAGGTVEEPLQPLVWLCRRALVCASIVMALSIAWSFVDAADDLWNDVAIANYELRADVMP